MFSRQAHIASVSQNKQTSARDAKRTEAFMKVFELELMFFFKASGFWEYEDGERVRGEILRWVAERVDEGGIWRRKGKF